MNKVRWVLSLALLIVLLTGTEPAWSDETGRVRTIGYLAPDPPSLYTQFANAFRMGLRDVGYIEGQNLQILWRFANNDATLLPTLASELVQLKVEVLVADGGAASLAAKQATTDIPIVVASSADLLGAGLVSSLAHPGGNLTGSQLMSPGLAGKRLSLLKEMAPKIHRVAVLVNPHNQGCKTQLEEAQAVAPLLRLQLSAVEIGRSDDFDTVLPSLIGRFDAIMVTDDQLLDDFRGEIGAYAIRGRMPSICGYRMPNEIPNCLMWYGSDLLSLFKRAGTFVSRILQGSKPGDLPVEQPTRFMFTVNAKTASAIGLSIPKAVLQAADDVVR
jgi:putative ABC transport system substrate-binding protein